MAAAGEKSSTLARWRKKVAVNVKGKKRALHNVEEENPIYVKERRTNVIIGEHRQAFKTIDNKVPDVKLISNRKGTLRSSKTCVEQEGRKVGIVPPQAAARSEPMAGEVTKESGHHFGKDAELDDIPAKRNKRGKMPPFSIPVPRPILTSDQSMNMNTLGWAIDTLMKPPENVVNIDEDESDLFMHPEYHSDIISYLREIETKYAHRSIDFLEVGDVTAHMRKILVDWLIQVQLHLVLLDETLHLCVTLIDRMLSRKPLQLDKFQLLGISCLFVAAKYTERFAPEISTLIHLTDNTYNYQQVLDMEVTILNTLKFDLSFADPYQFLERYLKAARCTDDAVRYMCMYFLDLSLIEAECIVYKPSMVAAAAVCLVRQILNETNETPWTPTLAYYSKYRMHEMIPCMKRLARSLLKLSQSKYTAARDKYSSKEYLSVSKRANLVSNQALRRIASDEI